MRVEGERYGGKLRYTAGCESMKNAWPCQQGVWGRKAVANAHPRRARCWHVALNPKEEHSRIEKLLRGRWEIAN
jgi:hypothetical protein